VTAPPPGPATRAAAPALPHADPATGGIAAHDVPPELRAPAPELTPSITKETADRLHLYRGPSRGADNAPVTIVVFQDNICPYCGHALGTIDQLLDEYPGKLRLVVKQLPVHKASQLSAEASYAADAQGKFWELHDLLLQNQEAAGQSRDALIQYAHQIGLDVPTFTAALDHHDYAAAVAADEAAAKEIQINATPSFVINGRKLVGALPIEEYRRLIDQALQD
jgi:protein-disulfide isomerase